MKYKKPQGVRDWMNWHGEESAHAVAHFLDSLPSEFEILGPGERAVVWPPQCNKAALNHAAKRLRAEGWDWSAQTIDALATIAPEAPKKRMVNLWSKSLMNHVDDIVLANDNEIASMECRRRGWRQVGQCEIEG